MKDLFQKEQDPEIFRLGILGNGTKARQLSVMFDSDACIVKLFDNIDDLIEWKPNNIMLTGDNAELSFHKAMQNSNIAITLYEVELSWETFNGLREDYFSKHIDERVVFCFNIDEQRELWGGKKFACDNLHRVYDAFAKVEPLTEEVHPLEAMFLISWIHRIKEIVKGQSMDIKEDIQSHDILPNKMIRKLNKILFNNWGIE